MSPFCSPVFDERFRYQLGVAKKAKLVFRIPYEQYPAIASDPVGSKREFSRVVVLVSS